MSVCVCVCVCVRVLDEFLNIPFGKIIIDIKKKIATVFPGVVYIPILRMYANLICIT